MGWLSGNDKNDAPRVSASDMRHEKQHLRALRKLGVSGAIYQDDKGPYTVQTGGRKLSSVEKGAVMFAAGGHAAADLRKEGVRLSGAELREARALARKLR